MSREIVEFFRFHRPFDYKLCHVKSDQGITMYVVLDYTSRLGIVSFAVCNGDNFNKAIGKHIARQRMSRGEKCVFTLEEFADSCLTIRDFVYKLLTTIQPNLEGVDLIISQLRK